MNVITAMIYKWFILYCAKKSEFETHLATLRLFTFSSTDEIITWYIAFSFPNNMTTLTIARRNSFDRLKQSNTPFLFIFHRYVVSKLVYTFLSKSCQRGN